MEDYDKVKEHTWYYNKRGYPTTNIRKPDGKSTTLGLHQLVMPPVPDGLTIDHIHHPEGIAARKADNRKSNPGSSRSQKIE